MAWFKVDDGFYSSRKVTKIPRGQRWAAIGLWTLAGAWCAKELTDGVIPDYQLEEMGGRVKDAEALVAVGLWLREGSTYRFHDWDKYQPTRVEVEEARHKEAERKRRYRESLSQRDNHGTPTGRDAGHQRESGHPDPTRPDPTRPGGENAPTTGIPSPYCRKHPNGTDTPCGACGSARMLLEAHLKAAKEEAERPKSLLEQYKGRNIA